MQQYSDRPAMRMRVSFGGRMSPAVLTLLIANGAVFIIQWIAHDFVTAELFGLSAKYFRPWQFLTSMFMHGDFGHIAMNMFALFLLGKDVERGLGTRRFVFLYGSAGIFAGLCHLLVTPDIPAIGASGAVFGVLVAFAFLFPQRKFWFVLPAKYFVLGYIVLETILLVTGTRDGIAHAAHLGGAAWGFLFLKARPIFERLSAKRAETGRLRGYEKARRTRRRIDELLEKISREGIGSLSDEERDFLTKAGKDRRQ